MTEHLRNLLGRHWHLKISPRKLHAIIGNYDYDDRATRDQEV
jgi:hypothetical protein